MPDTTTAPPTDEQQASAGERMVRGESDATEQQRAEQEIARTSRELVQRGDWTLPARHQIDQAQLQVLQATVAKDLNPAEMAMFLEVSSRYSLDPFLKHVYAAKFDGSNGGVTIFTGRDGLLHAARQTGKYVRMISAVVREKDEFEVETRLGEELSEVEGAGGTTATFGAGITRLRHVRKGMGDSRGAIIGAYALVWRLGDPEPYYAEAPWSEHGAHRQKDGNNKPTTWTIGNKKGFPEQMMRKVAESIGLRMTFGITGIVGAEELGDAPERVQNLSDPGGAEPSSSSLVVQYGEDDLGRELRELAEVANELIPNSWRPAKIAMRINGKDDDARLKLRDTLRRFIGQRTGGRERLDAIVKAEPPAPPEAEVVDDGREGETTEPGNVEQPPAAEPEGEVVDAEIVAEIVPEELLPEYDEDRHSALVDAVVELREVIEAAGADTLEGAEATAELEQAERELAEMNKVAEAAGLPRREA